MKDFALWFRQHLSNFMSQTQSSFPQRNSLESIDSVEFTDFFVKMIAVFELDISCVRNQHATSTPEGHR